MPGGAKASAGEQPPVEQLPAFDQLQLRFRDPVQRRYEIIRPVLLDECTAAERAAHTHLHPDTIGKLKRRFEQQAFPVHRSKNVTCAIIAPIHRKSL
jgi:hypothetical protein